MRKRTPAGEELTRLIMTAFRLQGSLERHGVALTRPFAQTPARWQVLSAAWDESRSVPQIARRMGLSRQAVQRVANLLVADGLATFAPNPDHRGSPIVQVTPRGVSLVHELNAAQSTWVNAVARHLDRRRLAAAVRAIDEVVGVLERHGVGSRGR